MYYILFFFFSSRRRHTRSKRDWSSDVCSSDLARKYLGEAGHPSLQARLAEVLPRNLVGADVRRALEDLPHMEALPTVRLRVVDHPIGHVQRARDGEHRLRRDVVLRESGADRDHLEDRARFEGVVD